MARLRHFLAFTLLAPTLALAMIVTGGGSPAYALKAPIDLGKIGKEGLQIGQKIAGSNVAKGATLFGRFSNPVGWTITAGTAAWFAYENRDSIINFIGGGDTPKTAGEWKTRLGLKWDFGPAWTTTGSDGVQYVKVLSVTGRTVRFEHGCNQGLAVAGDSYYGYTYRCGQEWNTNTVEWAGNTSRTTHGVGKARCRTDSGSHVLRDLPGSMNSIGYVQSTAAAWKVTKDVVLCQSGETLVGFYAPPANMQPVQSPPTRMQNFGIAWGTITLPDTAPRGGSVKESDPIVFREAKVTVRCKNGNTGETSEIRSVSEYGKSGTVAMPSCKEHFGPDWYATGFTIAPTKPETETGEPLPDGWEVPDFPPVEWDELIPDKEDADWQPCLGTKDGCSLGVWIDDVPCSSGNANCSQWTRVMEKDPNRVKCMYGAKQVPMRNCYPIAYPLDATQPGQNTSPEVNETPGNGTQTKPNPGTDAPANVKPPQVGTGTTAPPVPNHATDAPAQKQCFPKGWGMLNPFEWVYKPVKCALEWGFKPETPMSVRVDRMKANVTSRAPFSWFAALSGLPNAAGGSGGCPTSWALTIKGESYSLICGTAAETWVRGARPVWVVLAMAGAVYPLIRSLVYASTPVIKPTPTS